MRQETRPAEAPRSPAEGRKAGTPTTIPPKRYGGPHGHSRAAIPTFCQMSPRCPDSGCMYRVTGRELAESMDKGTLLAFENRAADCVIYGELAKRGPLHPLWFLGIGEEKSVAGRRPAKKGRKVGA